MLRNRGQGRVDVLVPPLAAGQHEGRRIRTIGHGLHPATHQVRHVLAGLQRAQEADVVAALQAQGCLDALAFGVRDRVEDRAIHAVVGHVELRGIPARVLDRLVARGQGGHHQRVRAADSAADSGREETLLEGRVRLRVREERRVVQRDHHRDARELRARVVGGMQDVGTHLADQLGQSRLLPRHARRTRLETPRNRDDASRGKAGREVLGVALLDCHRQVHALVHQLRDEVVHVTADAAQIRGDGGSVQQDADRMRV